MPNKNSLDQFFTPPEVADYCVDFFKKTTGETSIRVLEPCAGGKAFAQAFENHGYLNFELLDIDPKSPDIRQQDFLEYGESFEGAAVITNPPFGYQSSLSIAFFNQAAILGAKYIALLTLANHGTDLVLNKLDRRYKLLDEVFIKADFLDPEGRSLNMRKFTLVFQVWQKSEVLRSKIERTDWVWLSKDYDKADLWIRTASPKNEIFLKLEDFITDTEHFTRSVRRGQDRSIVVDGRLRWLSPNILGFNKLDTVSIEDVREVIELNRPRSWIGYYLYPPTLNQFLDDFYSGRTFKTKQF